MIIGTAGHIDHGKTTLVKALTGTDCDRLREEKERGITLDLGYAFRRLPAPGTADPVLGFIDVPGHEKLIHNMLAGATGIDFALLVIAADDGPMPQTREHLDIIELLGIRQGAVALTKIDLVDAGRQADVIEEIEALLEGTSLRNAPVFAVDARNDTGIDTLNRHLETCAAALAAHTAQGRFRLAVDRVFTLTGTGTVVTGTAFSGSVKVGDTLVLSPGGKSVRVRSLRAQGEASESGSAGQRIALALSGIEKSDVERGMWVIDPTLLHPQRCLSVALRVLPSQPPLRHWTHVHVHLGTDDIPARVALLSADSVEPGGTGLAELVLERETNALANDRFILRDAAARVTLAGGKVLDVSPPARKKRAPERLALLSALTADDRAGALAMMADRQAGGADLASFALNHNLDAAALAALCTSLALRTVGDAAYSTRQWTTLQDRVIEALTSEHTRHPDMAGIESDRLRRLTHPSLLRRAFDALIAELLDAGSIARTGAWLHLPGHRVQLGDHDRRQWEMLRPLLAAESYNPPRVRDIARSSGHGENDVRMLLKRVARLGEVYPVALDHYFTAGAVADLAEKVAQLCHLNGAARAADLRDMIGGGRKVAIQILEFFDRIGYTRRVRDTHVLRDTPGENRMKLFKPDK
ncbi:selenocysteine-specific translation elongation factor [uncultured Propionivibrio sp.]|uniref:selenocysteine-specific translation elongation factor n=1 Tax=uncultured Propionivibrio sp. TaxID=426737 RepID=UPI0029BFB287|nr:selenocysteine-specific translation elongation factor [uncultured Propionivibrio sp.]